MNLGNSATERTSKDQELDNTNLREVDADLRKTVIEQVAKEIQAGADTIISLRTRSAFTIWIGPYIVLGSIVVAIKGGITVNFSLTFWVAMTIAVICYLILGHLAGGIEFYTMTRSNKLRNCIASIANSGKLDMSLYLDEELPRKIYYAYWAVFVTLLSCFFGVVVLVSTIEPKPMVSPAVQNANMPNSGENTTGSFSQKPTVPKEK